MDRNAGGMNLDIARVSKTGPPFIGPKGGSNIGGHGICGEIKGITISTSSHNHGMAAMALKLAGNHIANHDPPGLSILDHQIKHLPPGHHGDLTQFYLAGQR